MKKIDKNKLTEYILEFILGVVMFILIATCANLFINDKYPILSIFIMILTMITVVVSAGLMVASITNIYALLTGKHFEDKPNANI